MSAWYASSKGLLTELLEAQVCAIDLVRYRTHKLPLNFAYFILSHLKAINHVEAHQVRGLNPKVLLTPSHRFLYDAVYTVRFPMVHSMTDSSTLHIAKAYLMQH